MYKIIIKIVRYINTKMYEWNIRRFHKYVIPEMLNNLEHQKGASNLGLMLDGISEVSYTVFPSMKVVGKFTPKDIERKLGELANAEE